MKTKRTSPTARALAQLRKDGFVAGVVEQTIPRTFIKRDFLNFVDIIYLTEGSIVALQVTSGSNHAARVSKILTEPRAASWLKAGGLIEVWSFSKTGARGERKLWTLRREELTLEDFK